MRAGLRDGSVPADIDGGRLHDIASETYVVARACFEAFAAGRDLAPATVGNRGGPASAKFTVDATSPQPEFSPADGDIVADRATNIAERVVYLVTGKMTEANVPK